MKNILRIFMCFCMFYCVSANASTLVPSWWSSNDYQFSKRLRLGATDVDGLFRSSDENQVILLESLDIKPGTEWYVWSEGVGVSDTSDGIALISWSGYNEVSQANRAARFTGQTLLAHDNNSSPLGMFPALSGEMSNDGTGNGGLFLYLCGVDDLDCDYSNQVPYPGYTLDIFMAFQPASEVPLPAGIYLFLSGLVGLGFTKSKRKVSGK